MVKAYTRLAVIFGLAALFVATLGAQDRPLPDQETFLKETRKHLQTDSSVQRSYMYVETQRIRKLDKDGRIAGGVDQGVRELPGAAWRASLGAAHFGRRKACRRK